MFWLCVCDIGINNSDIYKGVRLLSALYVSTAFLKLYLFSMVGHPKALNILLRLRVKPNVQDKYKKIVFIWAYTYLKVSTGSTKEDRKSS